MEAGFVFDAGLAGFAAFGFDTLAFVAAAFAAATFFTLVFAVVVFFVVVVPDALTFFTVLATAFFAGAAGFLASLTGTLDDFVATGFFVAGFVALVAAVLGLTGFAF